MEIYWKLVALNTTKKYLARHLVLPLLCVKTNHKLNSLRLNNNNITDVTSIGEALKTNKTLTRLSLSYNNITDVRSIIDGLKTNNRLHRLYLDSNQLSRNMKSQLKIIQRYKRDGLNGYQQVGGRGHNQQMRIRT